ncbi:MAG: YkvA family protein [Ignavibacteria bacterium]|nr:YkvA family protein [Ignavibacteria bacterium]
MNTDIHDFSNDFSEESFWKKIKKFAVKAGKEVIEKALVLYYCFIDGDTPVWAKGVILCALGYFISPADAIPDITPLVGFADDLGALIGATAAVAAHIKREHVDKAKGKLKEWFQ